MKVGYALEERLPVRPDLFSTAEASIWMNGLLTPVVRMEAGDKLLQVMLVHRVMQTLEDVLRVHVFLCAHGLIRSLPWRLSNPARQPSDPHVLMKAVEEGWQDFSDVARGSPQATLSVGAARKTWFAQRSVLPMPENRRPDIPTSDQPSDWATQWATHRIHFGLPDLEHPDPCSRPRERRRCGRVAISSSAPFPVEGPPMLPPSTCNSERRTTGRGGRVR